MARPDDPTIPCIHGPVAVVLPSGVGEVQAVVRVCGPASPGSKALSTGRGGRTEDRAETARTARDLRCLNRSLDIDEKNPFALVEPYAVCFRL